MPSKWRSARRMARYLLVRLVTVGLAISLGVFATILLANRGGAIDAVVERDIQMGVLYRTATVWADLTPEQVASRQLEWENEAGLHLPFLPRHLRWLGNALAFRWGESLAKSAAGATAQERLAAGSVGFTTMERLIAQSGPTGTRFRVTNILATRLPHTLLLVGVADLVVFLGGIPLALYLARRPGKWPDRLVGLLTPLGSIPSWMHGILLVLVFYVGLHLLPLGKMSDPLPAATWWQGALVVARHMILPVAAILLALFLQCVAAWRAFFQVYATEDYMELAVAKGLAPRTIERRYLLRSTLPYVITSFSLTLLGFWQTTTALEYFFDWPGIGQAYVEAIRTGDVVVAVGVVVIFAYLLGLLAIVLDLLYAIVDPRIRLGESGQNVRPAASYAAWRRPAAWVSLRAATSSLRSLWRNRGTGSRNGGISVVTPAKAGVQGRRDRMDSRFRGNDDSSALRPAWRFNPSDVGWRLRDGWDAARRAVSGIVTFSRGLARVPSAVVGLAIIALLVAMSGYALAAVPPGGPSITDKVVSPDQVPPPDNALPVWVNWFRSQKLPSTITLDSRSGQAKKEVQGGEGLVLSDSEGTAKSIRLTFTFDYSGFPKDFILRFYPGASRVFVAPRWVTPDGREIALKARTVDSGTASYDVSASIPESYLTAHALYDQLRTSGSLGGGHGGLPVYAALFTDPGSKVAGNLSGTYSLVVDGQALQAGADLDARLTLIGQVSGWAGTDDSGNDLWAALLWGAPAALIIGLAGGAVTTLLSLVLAAAGAWFGGAWDGLIQRLTEATMVLPVLAIAVILQQLFGFSLWLVMGTVVLVSALGTPLKSYRAAFLQVKEAAYIEAARAYGAGNRRIILRYMIPRIAPMIAPQLAILVPGFVFLEATLAIFGVSGSLPTWGNLIYSAVKAEIWQGNYWALIEPVFLCILTGLGFALLASALERVLNPRLRTS